MGEVVVWDLIAESDCTKNSKFDELIAQLQAENRLLEELLGRDATDQTLERAFMILQALTSEWLSVPHSRYGDLPTTIGGG